MKRFFSLAILTFLASSAIVYAKSMRDETFNPCPVSLLQSKFEDEAKIVRRAEREKEGLESTLKKNFNIDAEMIIATYPTLEQLNLEMDKLFKEGNEKILSAAGDSHRQLLFSAAIKARAYEINTQKKIAKYLKEIKEKNILIESLNVTTQPSSQE